MLEKLVFRTAIPFGYLIFWGGLLLAAVVGLAVTVSSTIVARWRPWGFVLGLGLMSAVGALAWVNIRFDAALDMNPYPVDRSSVVGTWRDADARLALHSDGTFQLDSGWLAARLGNRSSHGSWVLTDWNLRLRSNDGNSFPPLRVILFGSEYRIILDDFEDPDMWDGRLGFSRDEDVQKHPALTSNQTMNLPARLGTARACARSAPIQAAGYRQR